MYGCLGAPRSRNAKGRTSGCEGAAGEGTERRLWGERFTRVTAGVAVIRWAAERSASICWLNRMCAEEEEEEEEEVEEEEEDGVEEDGAKEDGAEEEGAGEVGGGGAGSETSSNGAAERSSVEIPRRCFVHTLTWRCSLSIPR